MTISRKQLALMHVARKKLGWTDAMYRSVLVEIAGVTSSTELDNDSFAAVMGFAEYCGFAPLKAKGQDYGDRPGMASFAQLEFIRTLWREYTRFNAGEDELNKWLKNKWRIDSLRFLRRETAPKIITALKVMKARAA